VADGAHMRIDGQSLSLQPSTQLALEVARGSSSGRLFDSEPAVLGIAQIIAQDAEAASTRRAHLDVVRAHGRKHDDAAPPAGEQHIEAPVPAAPTDRAEPLSEPRLSELAAIGERDHDHVALVTLEVLEVLDEERLGIVHGRRCVAGGEITLDGGIACDAVE